MSRLEYIYAVENSELIWTSLYTRRSQATTDNAIDHLSEDVQTLRQSLESQISNFQPGQGIVLGEHVS